MSTWRHYLLERVVRQYVQNVDQVLEGISIPRLLFGSARLKEVQFVPESLQDMLFPYIFYAFDIRKVQASGVEVSVDWLSISSRSIVLKINKIEADVIMQDPNELEAVRAFWDAQSLRSKVDVQTQSTPAETTVLYKVLSGLDIIADSISINVRLGAEVDPRLHATMEGFRYCPATAAGHPTNDLDSSIRQRPTEFAYSYNFEVRRITLTPIMPSPATDDDIGGASMASGKPLPEDRLERAVSAPAAVGDSVQPVLPTAPLPLVSLEGLVLASHGHCPASRTCQTPFYVESVLAVEFKKIWTPSGPAGLEGVAQLVSVLSRGVQSDGLRGVAENVSPDCNAGQEHGALETAPLKPGDFETPPEEPAPEPEREDASPPLQPATPGASTAQERTPPAATDVELQAQERLLDAQRTKRDIAQLLAGCTRSSQRSLSFAAIGAGESDAAPRLTEEMEVKEECICKCGTVLAPDAAFCFKCGKPRAQSTEKCTCGNVFLPDAVFCYKCGKERSKMTATRGRTSRRGSRSVSRGRDCSKGRDRPLSRSPPQSRSPQAPSHAASAISPLMRELEDDSDDFMDCEDFDLLELPDSKKKEDEKVPLPNFCLYIRDGGLKRSTFSIGDVSLQLAGPKGLACLELKGFSTSTDARWQLQKVHLDCLRRMYELTAPPKGDEPQPRDLGIIYAGATLATASLSFAEPPAAPAGSPSASRELPLPPACDIFRLQRGLRLRHRGAGEPAQVAGAPAGTGSQQLVQVEVEGVFVRDGGREELMAMGQALAAAVAPAPTLPAPQEAAPSDAQSTQSGVQVPISYNLEAVDVTLEASIGEQAVCCSVPCLRVRSVLCDFNDAWSYTYWAAAAANVTRAASDPLGTMDVAPHVPPRWGAACTEQSSSWHCGGGTALEAIANLEVRLEEERRASQKERERARHLEDSMEEVIRLVRDWPTGPMPLALQRLVSGRTAGSHETMGQDDEDGFGHSHETIGLEGEDAAVRAPEEQTLPQPGVATAKYEIDTGKSVSHYVENLQRGTVVEWAVEEIQMMTVDVTVIIRSRCRLHAARRLRETLRVSSHRDSFEVTNDFGEDQLPLTLEIQLSNEFSWFAAKIVRLKVCKAED